MKDTLLSLSLGISIGAAFTLCKLPIPAPPVFAGIAGIFGVYAGMKLIQFFQ